MSRRNRNRGALTLPSNLSGGGDLVYECMNRKCGRYMVAVIMEDNKLNCTICGGWLRKAKYRLDGFDTPPLIVGRDGEEGMLPMLVQPRLPIIGGVSAETALRFAKSYQATPPEDDTFHCTPDVKGCPIAKDNVSVVNIPIDMWDRWLFLAKKMDVEWIAYLKGEVVEDGGPDGDVTATVYNITEMYFPKQTMQSATCEAEPNEIQEGTIGAVHSHVAMKAFFSSTDEAHFNHPVEMVVNRAGDVDCRVRVKLECGRFQRVVAKVMLSDCGDRLAQLEQLKAQRVESKMRWQQPERPISQAEQNRLDALRENTMWDGEGHWGGRI